MKFRALLLGISDRRGVAFGLRLELRAMGINRTVGDHVKITYLHTLHHFALDARSGNAYHGFDVLTKTAASPAAVRLDANPAYTIDREPVLMWRELAPVHVQARSASRDARPHL
jgi:hypothetical protein